MSRGWIQRVQEAPGFVKYLAKAQGKTIYHRTDGPAHIHSSVGTEAWFVGGELHRLDGPALITSNGDEIWFANGKQHREDGPSVVRADGTKVYALHGVWYNYENWLKALGRANNGI